MRYFLVFFFVLGLHLSCFSQTITGTVREKGSGLPLPFANVFVNNTTIGSATDAAGRFRISGEFSTDMELVASFVGYVTEIENPWVLEFENIKPKRGPNYLQASAGQPLKITNEALGYKIDYYLQDFRLVRNGSMFYGQVFYSPTVSSVPAQLKDWEANREASYQSSLRHFNYSLLINSSDSLHFKVFRTPPEQLGRVRTNDFNEELEESIYPIALDSIFRKPLGNGNYRVYLQDRLEIHHLDKPWRNDYYTNVYHAISWIQAPDGYYDIDKKGTLINPTQLVLSGYMSRQRMARILPLDFEPNRKFVAEQRTEEVLESPAIRLNRLREKAWLATNKLYFYPGETVWIGGKMLYQDQNVADSLSRVLYVDLINTAAEIVQSATYPIEEGKISGGLELASDFPPGDYVLRAYTHWNQNFGALDQFVSPFLVMKPDFKPRPEELETQSFQGEISFHPEISITDSIPYRLMDLKLESITDAEAVSTLQPSVSLEEELNWLDKKLPANFSSSLNFPIEYGISVQGKFTPDNKRRPAINPITVVRGDLEDYGQVMTDSLGNFWATGLVFKDTAQVAIAALDSKMKAFGSVELKPFPKPDFAATFPKNSYILEPIRTEIPQLDKSGDYMLLEEFVKEEKIPETQESSNDRYGTPTQQVSGEVLEKETRFGYAVYGSK